MKLSHISEGHWQVVPFKYPNSLVKPGKGSMSIFVDPPTRNKYFKKPHKKRKK